MNRQERQKMINLADTIKSEINRMCVTDSLAEVYAMADNAIINIEKLRSCRICGSRTWWVRGKKNEAD